MNTLELYRPFSVGFDSILNRFAQMTDGINDFPRYNIVEIDENRYEIELAVAGYSKDDIRVEVLDDELTVTGEISKKDAEKHVYKGISSRKFTRKFILAEGVEVKNVKLENGILNIMLETKQIPAKEPLRLTIQ